MGNDIERRKKDAFKKYFGTNYQLEDVFGRGTFPQRYDELEEIASRYREWYKKGKITLDDVPSDLLLMYQIHHNLSGEAMSRAKLLSELTGEPLLSSMEKIAKCRSIPIPIDCFNGAVIYASTIYRGKTQVETGNYFEKKVSTFVNAIDECIEMVPGTNRAGCKYDKDIYINGEYVLSAEISFQVTTNSTMERKSHLNIPKGARVIMIFGGLGWIERINALERIASSESGYLDCFGPSQEELLRLRELLLRLKMEMEMEK